MYDNVLHKYLFLDMFYVYMEWSKGGWILMQYIVELFDMFYLDNIYIGSSI